MNEKLLDTWRIQHYRESANRPWVDDARIVLINDGLIALPHEISEEMKDYEPPMTEAADRANLIIRKMISRYINREAS